MLSLAEAIRGEIESPDFLLSVSRVQCSSDLARASVFVSVLPDNRAGTALKKLRAKSGVLSKIVKNKTRLAKIPLWQFVLDEDSKKRDGIEAVLRAIQQEK